jgi:polysaccharide biosynthesis transport protein
MLQNAKPQLVGNRNTALDEVISPAELVASFRSFVWRQFPVVLFVTVLTTALGLGYLLTAPPSYTARARMIIDTNKVHIFQGQPVFGETAIDTAMVDSQVEIMKSEKISLAVINRLHLTDDPEFVGNRAGLLGSAFGLVSNLFGSDAPKSEFQLTRRATEEFARRLTVKRVGYTYIIDITFSSINPDRAAEIANAVADEYIVDQLDAKFQATRRAAVWLQDRLRDLREQASAAQRAVVEFKTQNNIVTTGSGGRLMDEQRVGELNSQLIVARTQMAEAKARLDRIEAVLRSNAPNVTVDATVADSLKDEVITKLRTQYLEMANREAEFAARYGSTHLAVINLRNQMREIRKSILDELGRIAESYKSDYAIAEQREQSIQKELSQAVGQSQTTNRAQVTLRELESTARSYQSLYDNFLQRYMESVQQQSFPITEARVVTPASRSLKKSWPNPTVVVSLSIFGGLIFGLGIARLRDLSDRVFRTSAQVEATLQANCLAVVPAIKFDKSKAGPRRHAGEPALNGDPKRRPARPGTAASFSAPRTIAGNDEVLSSLIDAPVSRFAESIRSIKVAVDMSKRSKASQVIGITSAVPNEGKSMIALSLARLMSHAGARVILLDCDLRNPALSRRLAPSAKSGLLEVMSGEPAFDQVTWLDPSTKLTFLPAIVKPHFLHTDEILASAAAKHLIDALRKVYDYVIVDLSPLIPIADVRTTAQLVDSYIFVVEWGRTKREVAKRALSEAPGVCESMLGVVLNKANINTLSRYEGYGDLYNRKYYSRYGYSA